MIQKPNSKQLIQQFYNMKNDMEDMKKTISSIEEQASTKLSIIRAYNKIAQEKINELEMIPEIRRKKDCVIFALDRDCLVNDTYSIYGQTIHAPFAAAPSEIFNFLTESGPLYKDCAAVTFIDENGTKDYKYEYCNMLKKESDISKKDVFKMFDSNKVTLRIQLNHTNLYGNTECNMIEIAPYLPGTFDITEIRIFSITQYMAEGSEMEIPNVSLGSTTISERMKNVGTCRFMLNGETYQIYRIEFDINIHQQTDGYPFGLRHIYFYNAQMDTENDYAIVAINEDRYIEAVGSGVYAETPFGSTNTTAEQMGIEFYMIYNEGQLQNKIESDDIIARNLKTIYAKVPFASTVYKDGRTIKIPYTLTSLYFQDISLR